MPLERLLMSPPTRCNRALISAAPCGFARKFAGLIRLLTFTTLTLPAFTASCNQRNLDLEMADSAETASTGHRDGDPHTQQQWWPKSGCTDKQNTFENKISPNN